VYFIQQQQQQQRQCANAFKGNRFVCLMMNERFDANVNDKYENVFQKWPSLHSHFPISPSFPFLITI
jgi:hypothetical protein